MGVIDWGLVEGVVWVFGIGVQGTRWVVLATFMATYAVLGGVMEALWRAKRQASEDADTIRTQMGALSEVERRLAASERLATVGRLAAGVAHEVRNPLGVIRVSAVMLRDVKGSDVDRQRAGQFIVDEVDRLNRYVGALLDFSRPLTPSMRPIKVGVLLDGVALRARALEDLQAVTLSVGVADPDAETLLDEALMGQVLLGLIVNAAQAKPDQAAVVQMTHKRLLNKDMFEVADRGPGLPTEVAAHLFEPFVTTKPSGTGLGLAMARKVVEAHGAVISYCAREGGGACFRITLNRDGAP